MRYIVEICNGRNEMSAECETEKEAVRVAQDWARCGNITRIYKLTETHYFDADYQKKVNM